MDQKATEQDLKVFAQKEALREKDRQAVVQGEQTWAEVNRTNALGASVVHLYKPVKQQKP